MSRGVKGGRNAINPFTPGSLARRKPEFMQSGGWAWGDAVLRVTKTEYGFLIFKAKKVTGDFYYGFFDKVGQVKT